MIQLLLTRAHGSGSDALWPIKTETLGTGMVCFQESKIPVVEVYAMLMKYVYEYALQLWRAAPVRVAVLTPETCPDEITKALQHISYLIDIPLFVAPLSTACLFAHRDTSGSDAFTEAIWKKGHPVLVHDFGATKLSVSCLVIEHNEPVLVATQCHYDLGGQDFDNCIVQIILDEAKAKNVSHVGDPLNFFKVRNAAIQAKYELSFVEDIGLSLIIESPDDAVEGTALDLHLTRRFFEEKAATYFTRALNVVEAVMRQAQNIRSTVNWSECICIAAGGCIVIPKVRTDLRKLIPSGVQQRNILYGDTLLVSKAGAAAWAYMQPIPGLSDSDKHMLTDTKKDLQERLRVWQATRESQVSKHTILQQN